MENFKYEVLIIDDDPISRKLIRRSLSESEFVCHEEENIGGVIDFLIENSPHIIFLDLNLPDINGFDFIKESRDLIPRDCKLIIVSGYGKSKLIQKAFSLGVKDYIVKPISPNQVKKLTRDFIRDHINLEKTFDDYEIDVVVKGTLTGLGENNLIAHLPVSLEFNKKVEIESSFLDIMQIEQKSFLVTDIFVDKTSSPKSNVFKFVGLSPAALNQIRSKIIKWPKVLD